MKRLYILFASASFLMVSCQKLLFSDEDITREIHVENFSVAKIRGVFDIVLIQDSTDRLVINGKKDVRSIDVFAENDTLFINDPLTMSFNMKRNMLAIHFTNLEQLVTYNPVSVSNTDTLKVKSFSFAAIVEIAEVSLLVDCNDLTVVSANTLGHFRLRGRSDYLSIASGYGCSFMAGGLLCRHADIIHESIGDVFVNASGSITAYIRGPGNIYYHGNPVIEIAEKRGDGRLIRMD